MEDATSCSSVKVCGGLRKKRQNVEQVGLQSNKEEKDCIEDTGPSRLNGQDRHYFREAEPDLDQDQETETEPGDGPVEVYWVCRLFADKDDCAYR